MTYDAVRLVPMSTVTGHVRDLERATNKTAARATACANWDPRRRILLDIVAAVRMAIGPGLDIPASRKLLFEVSALRFGSRV